jgi:YfiH family protein
MGFLEVRIGATRVAFTDRRGGVSVAPYDTANLGLLTGDEPDRVRENRRRIAEAIGGAAADPERWFRIRQVHGASVLVADRPHAGPAPPADAVVTAAEGLPLGVLTADCAPVALVAGDALGAVHAGWRGLVGGVVERAVDRLRNLDRAPVQAVIGPCIHAERYAFGDADLQRVAARLGPGVRAETASGGPALDLRAAVRSALTEVGVTDVTDVDVCTAASSDHFSFRRDGPTGRQAMLVVREP